MRILDILDLVEDTKLSIEIIEKDSGASFNYYNKNTVPVELLRKKAIEINVQYFQGTRFLVIKF